MKECYDLHPFRISGKKKKRKKNKTENSILELIQNSQFFYITREIPYCQHLSFFDFVEYLTIYGMV